MYKFNLVDIKRMIFPVVGILALPLIAHAAIAPSPWSYRLSSLFTASDAVCWGKVMMVDQTGSRREPDGVEIISRSIWFSAERCYKGTITEADRIDYDWRTPAAPGAVNAGTGDSGLVFLRRHEGVALGFTDPFWGWLRDARLRVLAPSAGSGLQQLEADVLLNLRESTDAGARARNLRLLGGFDTLSVDTIDFVRSLSREAAPVVVLGSFSILVTRGGVGDLTDLCHYLSGGTDALDSVAQDFSFSALAKLREPADRTALECIAATGPTPIRFSAMDAIRGISSPASVPVLVRLLDDSNPMILYLAVITLTEITHRSDAPGPLAPNLMGDPARFRDSWKAWWDEKGRALYPEVSNQ